MAAFDVQCSDSQSAARCAALRTPHGDVETPAFMPVGTQAAVKGLTPAQLLDAGAQIVLANTYHLALRPGEPTIAALGGLHRFMGWPRPILTDSGGFQLYSLAELCQIDDGGATFRSHIDGRLLELSPERSVAVQEALGADIIMCLDECPPFGTPADRLRDAVRRTVLWAERCRAAHRRTDQLLFAIVQGGTDLELRHECVQRLTALDFPGYALGGLSVGESPHQLLSTVNAVAPLLPGDKPRYLMGVGRPQDILHAVACGIDLFDCVLPTRNGRNAAALTYSGTIRLRNAAHARADEPLDRDCPCYTCRNFSRAYLRHLFMSGEMLGPVLVSLHNVAFYCRLMAQIRRSIRDGHFAKFSAECLTRLGES